MGSIQNNKIINNIINQGTGFLGKAVRSSVGLPKDVSDLGPLKLIEKEPAII